MISVGGVLGVGGSFGKPPNVIGRPKTSKKLSLTAYAMVLSGVPSLRKSVTSFGCRPATRRMDRLGSFKRTNSTGERSPEVIRPSVSVVRTEYKSCGVGYGKGFKRTALTVLNIAV